jgi:hypothetical protein
MPYFDEFGEDTGVALADEMRQPGVLGGVDHIRAPLDQFPHAFLTHLITDEHRGERGAQPVRQFASPCQKFKRGRLQFAVNVFRNRPYKTHRHLLDKAF